MRTPTAVLDLEISGKFTELNDIGDFAGALVLFRLHGRPLGWGAAPVTDGRLDRGALVRQLLEQHAWSCALPLAEKAVLSGIAAARHRRGLDAALAAGWCFPAVRWSRWPCAAAHRRRSCSRASIRSLALDYAPLDLVLIDASDDRARVEALIRDHYPTIRYSRRPASARRRVRRWPSAAAMCWR